MNSARPNAQHIEQKVGDRFGDLTELFDDSFFETMDVTSKAAVDTDTLVITLSLAEALSKVLGGDDDVATYAAYRAYIFAYEIAVLVSDVDFDLHIGAYIHDIAHTEDPSQTLTNDADGYLQNRPHVDALIGRYIMNIDPSHIKWSRITETVCAITFMIAEQGIAKSLDEQRTREYFDELEKIFAADV